jgi:hypothetical protein
MKLLAGHRRYGHMHDKVYKRMVDAGLCGSLKWVPGIVIRANCWDCLMGQQRRNAATPDPNLKLSQSLSCQIMVWDWCGPHHVCGLHGELYWFLAVCPRGYHWGATASKKTEFLEIVDRLLRHIRGLVGDGRVRFVKFDGAPEFVTEPALEIFRTWKIDFRVNCPTHHWQTAPVERGHLIHQDSMRTMGSHANSPSVLWPPEFLLSVQLHNLKLHKDHDVCPYFDLTGLQPDTQFIFIWGCLAIVHNHAVNPDKFRSRGLPCIYVGTGYFENVHGGKFLDPVTGKYIFSTNMTITETFMPFSE